MTYNYSLLPVKILNIFIEAVTETITAFFRYIPGTLGILLRNQYYKRRLKYLGKGTIIDTGVYMLNPYCISINDNTWIDKNVILIAGKPKEDERVFIEKVNKSYTGQKGELNIGKGCHIAPNVVVQAHGGVEIGDYVGLASGSKIYSMSHHYRNYKDNDKKSIIYKFSPMALPKEQCLITAPVVMKNNSALGLNSIILPGVTIEENSWIGVNSSVTQDIPPDSIAMGNPAKVIKNRFSENQP